MSVVQFLRRIFTVNADHVCPHEVYKNNIYRKAYLIMLLGTVGKYEPPQTPFSKVAGAQYFKRDQRRSYPKTLVMTSAPPASPSSSTAGTNAKNPMAVYSDSASEYPSEYVCLKCDSVGVRPCIPAWPACLEESS